jgi:prevent-host-death family protein
MVSPLYTGYARLQRRRREHHRLELEAAGWVETEGPTLIVRRSMDFANMRFSTRIKPISYLKANAAEVLRDLAADRKPLVITQNGEAKAVMQDVASYEETQETLALLKLLALSNHDVAAGRVKPLAAVVKRLRAKKAAA